MVIPPRRYLSFRCAVATCHNVRFQTAKVDIFRMCLDVTRKFEELKRQCYSQLYDLKIISEDHSETVEELVTRMTKLGFEVSL